MTGKLQKNTDFKREVIENNMATDNGLYNTVSIIHNGYYPKQIALNTVHSPTDAHLLKL